MKKTFNKKHIDSRHAKIPMLVGALSVLLLDRHAQAQSVLPPPPEAAVTPPALQAAQNDEMDVFATPAAQSGAEPLRWGSVILRPHPFYQFTYASGILLNPGQPVNTTIQQTSPGFLLEVGSHLTLDYTPTWTLYSDRSFADTFDNAARLAWGGAYNNWVLGVSQSYAASSAPNVQTGTQTSQENYLTTATASYSFNSKMSMDLAVNQNFNVVGTSPAISTGYLVVNQNVNLIANASANPTENLASYREWSTLDWLNYKFWPRLNVAAGIGLGYDDVQSSPAMLFEQYEARIQWRATDKISFQVHGGVEDLQFLSGGQSDLINPVFDGTIQYLPFEETKLSLTVQRSVSPAYFQNQATETTSFTGNLNQRLLGFLYLNLNGGYQITQYTSSISTIAVNREDDYYFLNTQLNFTFLKRGTVGIFYQLGGNSSSASGFGFVTHQVGFSIAYSY